MVERRDHVRGVPGSNPSRNTFGFGNVEFLILLEDSLIYFDYLVFVKSIVFPSMELPKVPEVSLGFFKFSWGFLRIRVHLCSLRSSLAFFPGHL